jgi:hypothetical protein
LGVSALKGFSLFVVATDLADEFASEIFDRDEDAASDDITLDFGKPDLNLVKPGGVGRCVMDANVRMFSGSAGALLLAICQIRKAGGNV